MAASSASADCMETARDLKPFEVISWFSDSDKQGAVFKRFISAQAAAMSHPAVWARTIWAGICKAMRQVIDKNPVAGDSGHSAFTLICQLLDIYVQQFQEAPQQKKPEAGPQEKRARNRQPDTEGRGPVVAVITMPNSSMLRRCCCEAAAFFRYGLSVVKVIFEKMTLKKIS